MCSTGSEGELQERVAFLERGRTFGSVLGITTAVVVVFVVIALRRQGILSDSLLNDAFPRAGGAGG